MADELPAYTSEPGSSAPRALEPNTVHVCSLANGKGRAWLSLRVTNSRAHAARALPLFADGDEIRGAVELDLEKSESAKAISVRLTAGSTVVGQDEFRFLDVAQTLWTPAGGEKLAGARAWPFALALPAHVQAAHEEKQPAGTHRAPPTFTERASPAYLGYTLTVTLKRGASRVDQTLATSITYWPRIVAEPPSELRRQAYAEGHGLVGPDGDPAGWHTLDAVVLKGTLFDRKEVEVRYEFSVAAPLSYAAGSPIPVLCTLSCADAHALDVLAPSPALGLHLARTLAFGSTAAIPAAHQRHTIFTENTAKARWWPAPDRKPQPGVRHLAGEIQVRKGVKPSFVFPRLSVYYHIVLFPPKATGFIPAVQDTTTPLLSVPVQIGTTNAPGVVPRSNAPPDYVAEQEEEGSYANTVGMLENGNQRFLGHHHMGA